MKRFLNLLKAIGISTHRRFRLLIRAVALLIGLYFGLRASIAIEVGHYETGSWLFVIVMVTALLEFVWGDIFADQSFPFDTERKLALMEKRVGTDAISIICERLKEAISKFKGCDPTSVSATVHVLAELNATNDQRTRYGLLQLTDYVGPKGGKKGRVTLITQGIIGRCARTEQIETADFVNEDEYYDSMIREFGFTKQEAKYHTDTARSYLAYPFWREKSLIGVIYFFTTEPQVFPKGSESANLDQLAKDVASYLRLVQLV